MLIDNVKHVYRYEREADEVSGRRPFHCGVACVLTSLKNDIQMDDVDCCASDEIDDVITNLNEGERPVSSVVTLNSKRGLIRTTSV